MSRLNGPWPVSRLMRVQDAKGEKCDTSYNRAEVVLDGDLLPVCWRLWVRCPGRADWRPGGWDLETPRETLRTLFGPLGVDGAA